MFNGKITFFQLQFIQYHLYIFLSDALTTKGHNTF